MATKVLSATMRFERETPGSVLYKTQAQDEASMLNIYIKKWALEKPFPREITVIVEVR